MLFKFQLFFPFSLLFSFIDACGYFMGMFFKITFFKRNLGSLDPAFFSSSVIRNTCGFFGQVLSPGSRLKSQL